MNSTASRAYLEIDCRSQYLMIWGQKHSLCLISMLSKTQPSESMPTKNSCCGTSPDSPCADMATVAIRVSSHIYGSKNARICVPFKYTLHQSDCLSRKLS